MKVSEAVRHLQSLGLVVDGDIGQRSGKGGSVKGGRRVVPVHVIKPGEMPKRLAKMIRQSRAEAARALRKPTGR